MVSTGDIALLQNEKLRLLIVKYDQSIEQNRFLYDEILAHHLRNSNMLNDVKVDRTAQGLLENPEFKVVDFDFDYLQQFKGVFEWNHIMHYQNWRAAKAHLAIAEQILEILRGSP